MITISPSSLPAVSPELAASSVTRGRGAKAAQEFEAQLIGSLLESLEKTFGSVPGEDQMPGADDYNYLGTHALAETLTAHGGFGLASLIVRHLPASAHEGKG
jgi:Rod binding domain-containing protein